MKERQNKIENEQKVGERGAREEERERRGKGEEERRSSRLSLLRTKDFWRTPEGVTTLGCYEQLRATSNIILKNDSVSTISPSPGAKCYDVSCCRWMVKKVSSPSLACASPSLTSLSPFSCTLSLIALHIVRSIFLGHTPPRTTNLT